jgi:hypothetical protein
VNFRRVANVPARAIRKSVFESIEAVDPTSHQQSYELRHPYARSGPRLRPSTAKEAPAAFAAYEQEDQSESGVRTGMRVRHGRFGLGTVVGIEDQGDDFKVTVKFNAGGTKKLMAKFAGLEPA